MRIDGIQLGLQYHSAGASTTAVKNADIRMEASGIVAITGPSGCGKSSLLYLLSGLKKPTSGTVYFDDADIESIRQDDLARIRRLKFGLIFQRHYLLDYLSVLDNVLVPANSSTNADIERAKELLSRLDMADLCARKPQELSQGQRQRVAVARAFINNPAVIFADEPTAALDRESTNIVMSLLAEYGKSASILLITHDPAVLDRAARVINMKDGQIASSLRGNP